MRLELVGITKAFGPLVANDHVDLTLEEGEIHCLLGENGAGKSTLMNILFGLLHADSGEIRIDGNPVRFADPGEAVRRGIGMVHQHFMLVPVFTVAENIVLGFEPVKRLGFLDRRKARTDILRISHEFGLDVPPDALVENLPVGAQQKVEILKALMRDAQVLILDEPTAVLTPQETEGLFKVIRSLAESGRSVLFITHKLKEVLAVADKITVMRLGKVVGHTTARETNEPALAAMMVGRSVDLVVSKAVSKPGPPVLELKDLTVQDERGLTVVDHVSLTVHSGEIVALAGVQGNGQTELTEAVTGLRSVASGTIRLAGRDLTNASPRRALRAGIANIPEDRQIDGLVLSLPISDNLVLDVYDQAPYAHLGARRLGFVRRDGEHKLTEFDIRANSVDTSVGTLSGGNQQKVVVARELSHGVTQLVASQPTRGLDVGSIEYVHRRIIDERDRGAGVLLVSSELDEVLALGDRIAVMYRGRIIGIVPPNVSRDRIGLMMAGIEDGATTTPGGVEPLTTADVSPGDKVVPEPGRQTPNTGPASADAPKPWWLRALRWMTEANVVVVTICAVIFGLFVGAILIIVTTPATLHALEHLFSSPGHSLNVIFSTLGNAYGALVTGSIISPSAVSHAISTGTGWNAVFTPLSETLVATTPLILAGTGVALGFATGVFNIGGQGQLIAGAIAATYVGFAVHLPIELHLPLVILAGAAGGAVAGFIPGILKARTGAHEVIVTIMLNYIFLDLLEYLLSTPPLQQPGQSNAISRTIPSSAQLPHLFDASLRVNAGLIVALVVAAGASWFMRKSTLGFEFKVIGANPSAGRTAGMNAGRATILVLTLSGALVGLAGMSTLSGTDFFLSTGYGGNTGFYAITVALVGRNRPIGVVFASLLFAALSTGGRYMQATTNIPLDLTSVIQAVIVFLVATPALVREIFHLRQAGAGKILLFTKGWGG